MSDTQPRDYATEIALLHREYREQLGTRMTQLQHLFEDEDWVALADALHRLTGSAASFGCKALGQRSADAEELLRGSPSVAELQAMLTSLAQLVEHERGACSD